MPPPVRSATKRSPRWCETAPRPLPPWQSSSRSHGGACKTSRFSTIPSLLRPPPRGFLDALRAHATRSLTEAEAEHAAAIEERLLAAMANVKRLHDAGVLIVAGTDAPYPGVFQGEGVHRELELLVEADLTPLQAITAATRNAAILMQGQDEWGSIAPGMAADLLVVRGNPAEDIGATRDIVAVIRNGVVLDRAQLVFDALNDPGFRTVGSVAAN